MSSYIFPHTYFTEQRLNTHDRGREWLEGGRRRFMHVEEFRSLGVGARGRVVIVTATQGLNSALSLFPLCYSCLCIFPLKHGKDTHDEFAGVLQARLHAKRTASLTTAFESPCYTGRRSCEYLHLMESVDLSPPPSGMTVFWQVSCDTRKVDIK